MVRCCGTSRTRPNEPVSLPEPPSRPLTHAVLPSDLAKETLARAFASLRAADKPLQFLAANSDRLAPDIQAGHWESSRGRLVLAGLAVGNYRRGHGSGPLPIGSFAASG